MNTCIKDQLLSPAAKKSLPFVQFTPERAPFTQFSASVEEEMPGGSHPGRRKAGLGRIFELLSLYK
jgi:hypothetical protein